MRVNNRLGDKVYRACLVVRKHGPPRVYVTIPYSGPRVLAWAAEQPQSHLVRYLQEMHAIAWPWFPAYNEVRLYRSPYLISRLTEFAETTAHFPNGNDNYLSANGANRLVSLVFVRTGKQMHSEHRAGTQSLLDLVVCRYRKLC